MTDPAPSDTPLAIDRVERARAKGGSVRLRMTGRWLGAAHAGEQDTLLVIQLEGRRHRFPADRDRAGSVPPGAWEASFSVPSWAEPRRHGQAALWVGNAVVPVPPPGSTGPHDAPASAASAAASAASAATPVSAWSAADERLDAAADPGRAGPLADLLLKETVAALQGELQQRSAEAARLRGALADARSELDSRAATQAGLEKAHGELRGETERLIAAVTGQRTEFDARLSAAEAERDQGRAELASERARALQELEAERALREQLAVANVSRDAAMSEAAGLRAELERLGSELAVAHEQLGAHGGDLGEAQRLLADARALSRQLHGETSQ